MGRYRAIMTETDRAHISGKSNPTQDQKDQAVYRVKQRITEEVPKDVDVLKNNRPDLRDELIEQVSPTPRLASSIDAYVAITDHPETGENEILFNGKPIKRVAAGGGSDKVTWGYIGGGPHNTAASILAHAKKELGLKDTSVEFNWKNFMHDYLKSEKGSYWALPLSEVQVWMQTKINEAEEGIA